VIINLSPTTSTSAAAAEEEEETEWQSLKSLLISKRWHQIMSRVLEMIANRSGTENSSSSVASENCRMTCGRVLMFLQDLFQCSSNSNSSDNVDTAATGTGTHTDKNGNGKESLLPESRERTEEKEVEERQCSDHDDVSISSHCSGSGGGRQYKNSVNVTGVMNTQIWRHVISQRSQLETSYHPCGRRSNSSI
jgi:hypothetical protein